MIKIWYNDWLQHAMSCHDSKFNKISLLYSIGDIMHLMTTWIIKYIITWNGIYLYDISFVLYKKSTTDSSYMNYNNTILTVVFKIIVNVRLGLILLNTKKKL